MRSLKNVRIVGDDRAYVAQQIVARYETGVTIRQIATESGRSYGWVHGILAEAGVLRTRARKPARS